MTKMKRVFATVILSIPVEVDVPKEKWEEIKDNREAVDELLEESYDDHLHNAHLYNTIISSVDDVNDED